MTLTFDSEDPYRMTKHTKWTSLRRQDDETPCADARENSETVDSGSKLAPVRDALELCIHQAFEKQVRLSPTATAASCGSSTLSFEDLNRTSNQLAHYLSRHFGIAPDMRVAICVERGLEMLIGLIAILKAGGAYVPIHPADPEARIRFLAEDSGATVMLASNKIKSALSLASLNSCAILNIENDANLWKSKSAGDIDRSVPRLTSNNLAYVMYTSGSTGTPKGVLIEHGHVLHQLTWMQDTYKLGSGDVVPQKAPFNFDLSVWEIWWPLLTGASIAIAKPDGHQDPTYMCEFIRSSRSTALPVVPSMLNLLLDSPSISDCSSLAQVFSIGEELSASTVRRFHEKLPNARLHNLYGPTEATVAVTAWAGLSDHVSQRVPIGKPAGNNRIHILGPNGQSIPDGQIGEIYISGDQIARGYINRPDLTKKHFFCEGEICQSRAYRTGDRGRRLPDGNIEFHGRIDEQVKFRGYRIEMGEIEGQLTNEPAIGEAAVVAVSGSAGDVFLAAYYTRDSTSSHLLEDLDDRLAARLKSTLPPHMVPERFFEIATMPLSTNGKLDRNALVQMARESQVELPKSPASAETPCTDSISIKRRVSVIWDEVLGRKSIDNAQSFLEAGGNSLQAVRLGNKIRTEFQVELPLAWLFSDVASKENLIESLQESMRPQGE